MFQLEDMLPLLILAFLGTPAVLTQTYHGSETGKHFCTIAPEGKNITEIRVSLRGYTIISIQLKYGEDWDQVYGSSGGKEMTASLNAEENIIGIVGTYFVYMHQIVFVSDQPREMMLGYFKGKFEYSDYPTNPNHTLKGICGYYVPGGIRGLSFVWGGPNSTCVH